MMQELAGSWQVLEHVPEESLLLGYECAHVKYLDIDSSTKLCSACAVENICGEAGTCVPLETGGLEDFTCDCQGESSLYIDPATNRTSCTDAFVISFDLDLTTDHTLVLLFTWSADYDTDGYPVEQLDFTVDWGDESGPEAYDSSHSGLVSHRYDADNYNGIITLYLTGTIERFNFVIVPESSNEAFITVAAWNGASLGLSNGWFRDCMNMERLYDPTMPINHVDYGLITTQRMFYGCTSFNMSLNHWDVSQVMPHSNPFYQTFSSPSHPILLALPR